MNWNSIMRDLRESFLNKDTAQIRHINRLVFLFMATRRKMNEEA